MQLGWILRIEKTDETPCAPFGRKCLAQRQVGGAKVGESVQFAHRHRHQHLPVSKSRVAPGRGYRRNLFFRDVGAVPGQQRAPAERHGTQMLRIDGDAEGALHIEVDGCPEPTGHLPEVLHVPDVPTGRRVGKNNVPRRKKPGFQQNELLVHNGNLPYKGGFLPADRGNVQVVDGAVAEHALRGHPEDIMFQRVGVSGSDHPLLLDRHEIVVQVRHVVRSGQGEFLAPRTGSTYGAYLCTVRMVIAVRLVGIAIKPQQVEGGIAEMGDAFVAFEHEPGLAHHAKRRYVREHALLAVDHLLHQVGCEVLARHQYFLERDNDRGKPDDKRFRLLRGYREYTRGIPQVLDDDNIRKRRQFKYKASLRIRNGAVRHVFRENMRAGQRDFGLLVRDRPPDAYLRGSRPNGADREQEDIEDVSDHI